MSDKRPNFFVVGAPKCGTSSLYAYMGQHPDFFIAPKKEPHFFSQPEVMESYYEQERIQDLQAYLALYEGWTSERFAGDFSPSYLFYGKSARRIHEFNPEAHILMILRNPVGRAVSHYMMDISLGYLKKPLADVLANPRENEAFYREYVQVGRYADQVGPWLDLFGERVRVMFYEDLRRDTPAFVADVFSYLGLDSKISVDTGTAHGAYRRPRSRTIERFRKSAWWQGARRLVPQSFKDRVKPMLDDRQKPDLGGEKETLRGIFADDISRLENILGKDLSFWKEAGS